MRLLVVKLIFVFSTSFRWFPVFPRTVVDFTIHIVLRYYFIKIMEFLLKNLRKILLVGNLLPVQFISAAFVNKEKIRRIVSYNLLCACVVQNRTTGNACQGTFNGLFISAALICCRIMFLLSVVSRWLMLELLVSGRLLLKIKEDCI